MKGRAVSNLALEQGTGVGILNRRGDSHYLMGKPTEAIADYDMSFILAA